MKEIWKTIEGYPHYQVSNLGNVRTTEKVVKCANGITRVYPSHPVSINPYYPFPLFGIVDEEGNGKTTAVKREVAKAFVPNPDNLTRVEVIDGNESNCVADNLKWVSLQEYRAAHYKKPKKKNKPIWI